MEIHEILLDTLPEEQQHVFVSPPPTSVLPCGSASRCYLSMLAITDLGLSLSTMPTVMSFLVNYKEISFGDCFAQLYFVHSFSFMESSLLLAMAHLLPAEILFHPHQTAAFGAAGQTCAHHRSQGALGSPGLSILRNLVDPYSLLLVLLYLMTLKTIASKEEQSRVLNTCISHICAVLIFDIPVIGLSTIYKFGKNASPIVHILMANICLLVSLVKQTVYSVKTKQICTTRKLQEARCDSTVTV
ncbi:LOW QUALITY PROTEIN: olfactory receptor 51L1-like [Morus bassanus]